MDGGGQNFILDTARGKAIVVLLDACLTIYMYNDVSRMLWTFICSTTCKNNNSMLKCAVYNIKKELGLSVPACVCACVRPSNNTQLAAQQHERMHARTIARYTHIHTRSI